MGAPREEQEPQVRDLAKGAQENSFLRMLSVATIHSELLVSLKNSRAKAVGGGQDQRLGSKLSQGAPRAAREESDGI